MSLWPTLEQKLLLKSGASDPEEASASWEEYTRLVDIKNLDYVSITLLPRVYNNLKNQKLNSKIAIESFNQCKSVYRKTWAENHLNWAKLLPTFTKLLEAKIEKIVLLKGMAMILGYYRDFGVRVIGDVDLLISKDQLAPALSIFSANGWDSQLKRLDAHHEGALNRWHSANFVHETGLNLDLHWSLMLESSPLLDSAVLKEAELENVNNRALYIASPTHLLLQTLVHGIKKSQVSLIRWIPDALTLIKHSKINWDELLYFAKSIHVSFPLRLGLQYLADEFQAPVPSSLLKQLKSTPFTSLEKREYKANEQGFYRLAGWYRHCLKKRHTSLFSQLLHLPRYLQNTARLKALWQLPFFMIYWIFNQFSKKIPQSYIRKKWHTKRLGRNFQL